MGTARITFAGVLLLLSLDLIEASPIWHDGFEPPPPQTRWVFPNLRPGDEVHFTHPVSWPLALDQADVFGMYVGALTAATPQQLSTVLGTVNAAGLDLVIETGGLRPCFCTGAAMAATEIPALERVEQNGISSFMVVMDNPWSFVGSPPVYAPPSQCPGGAQPNCAHDSLSFAVQLGNYMEAVRSRFPMVRFGWIESMNIYGFDGLPGLGPQGQFDLKPVIELTLDEARQRQLPLDFFHIDAPVGGILHYPTDPMAKFRRIEQMIRTRKLRFGILLTNGGITDAQFATQVPGYYDCYTGSGGRLDNVVVQSWWSQPGNPSLPLPTLFAPEDDPLSFTAVFNRVAARVGDPSLIQPCLFTFQP